MIIKTCVCLHGVKLGKKWIKTADVTFLPLLFNSYYIIACFSDVKKKDKSNTMRKGSLDASAKNIGSGQPACLV